MADESQGVIDNLLYNVTSKDTIYKIIRNTIGHLLPEDLRDLYESSPRVQIIGTDSFFIHYSVAPLLTEKHYDRILDKARGFFLRYMLSRNYQRLREKTVLDENLSIIYAVELTRYVLERISGKKQDGRHGESSGIPGGEKSRGKGEEGGKREDDSEPLGALLEEKSEEKGEDGVAGLEKALEKASDHARKVVEGASSVMELLGAGGAGSEPGNLRNIINLANSLLEVRDAERIVRMALETVRAIPRSHYFRKKADVLGDEVRGYARTTRLERMLPREIALPDDILMYKLLGEGVLRREKAFSRQGAIYVLVDKSGSMTGYKTIWSRSVALALGRIAKEKKSKFMLRLFDTNLYPQDKPVEDEIEAFSLLLTAPSNGGTRINRAVTTAVKDLETGREERDTDTLILVTDGEDNVSIDRKYLESRSIRLVTVMVGGDNKALEQASTAYFHAALTVDGAIDLVSKSDNIVLKKGEGKPIYRHT